MGKPSITAHMIVKNEDWFARYAISSVLPYVDRFLIYDTGSTDKTIDIISTFNDKKIVFERKEIQHAKDIGRLREEQIEKTKTDWFWIIDGDEMYSESLCKEILQILSEKGKELEGIVVGRYDLLGDIYHYQDESIGTYNLLGRKGHIVLRLLNRKNIHNLHIEGIYPYEGYYDKNGQQVIEHDSSMFAFTKGRIFHAMYLKRSSKGANLLDTFHRRKWKVELGKLIPKSVIPEVFDATHPSIVSNAKAARSFIYTLVASVITPIKMLKRKIIR